MKKKRTRLFSALLAAVLVFGTLPVSALGTDTADPPDSVVDESVVDQSAVVPEEEPAAEEEQSAEEENAALQSLNSVDGYSMNIFFLDCGRKYYSVDSIKTFINNASEAGFNYIQLAVGNEGLRFLLDDMTLTVNGTRYTSEAVTKAIQAGNTSYNETKKYTTTTNELTQDEMNTIIAYAHKRNMGVIPCVNTPGHMNAILSAASSLTGKTCSYNGSVRTIDVTNDTAVAFTQALLQKYINYFKAQGCQFFNMGADEYANDIYTKDTTVGMGFGHLQSEKQYDNFVTYINNVAGMIKDAGMTPMAFNDGIYYNDVTTTEEINTGIVVCYWSGGWGTKGAKESYTPASASALKEKGFQLINANSTYYYSVGSNYYTCTDTKNNGNMSPTHFTYTKFEGSSESIYPLGSMFCVWADYPGAKNESEVLSATKDFMTEFAKKCPKVDDVTETVRFAVNAGTKTLNVNGFTNLTASSEATWTVDNANVIALSAVSEEDAIAAAANTVTGKTVEATAVGAGTATVTAKSATYEASVTLTVDAQELDLSKADSLTVEYWITNLEVTCENAQSKTISAQTVYAYGENGVEFSSLVPAAGKSAYANVTFWKATRLDSDKTQKGNGATDQSMNGYDFTKIRYYNGAWQVWANETDGWQSVTTSGSSKHQIVAYYMQKTEVTTAVTTYVTDWGSTLPYKESAKNNNNFVLLDFAVNYGSGIDPNSFANSNTIAFHCQYNGNSNVVVKDGSTQYRKINRIYAAPTNNYEVYMITVTPSNDTKTEGLSYYKNGQKKYYNNVNTNWSDITINYAGTETVVWVDDKENLPDDMTVSDDLKTGADTNGQPVIDELHIYKNQAMLVTYYVKLNEPDSELHALYYVDGANEPFYDQGYAVKASTTFNENIGLSEDNSQVDNGEVELATGASVTVTADLTTMKGVPAAYRLANFKCVRLEKDEDLKTVRLYYSFNTDVSFLADFGTPLEIKLSDINDELARQANSIKETKITATHGTAKYENGVITYTPDASFAASKDGGQISAFFKGVNTETNETGNITYTIGILPASNVLYEEGFLSEGSKPEKAQNNKWSMTSATAATQQTQKAGETGKYVFGFDDTYASSTGANGTWSISGLEVNKLYTPLTTKFYGNTFDLIGTCGSDTGRIMLVFKNADGKYEKVVNIIDTRYTRGTIGQVPLAHVVLGNADAEHTVLIYASGLAAVEGTTNKTKLAAAASLTDEDVQEDEFLAAVLAENDIDLSEVEYVETTVMDELENSPAAASLYSTMLTDDGSGTTTGTSALSAGTHVDIDGFRVYRTTNSEDSVAKNYPADEQNIVYQNILDVVGETVTAFVDTATGVVTNYDVNKYEAAGGPQNEIYLSKNQSVTVQLKDANGNAIMTPVQISLRAVDGETSWCTNKDSAETKITSNTEMYYKVTPDADGVVTIVNKGENLLALGNVKFANNTTVTTVNDMSEDLVLASLQAAYGVKETETFTPETFKVKTSTVNLSRNKVITLKVNVSSDVAYVTVNGKKYTSSGLQGMFQKTRTIRVTDSAKKNAEKTYEIIAYNADGVASEVVTKTVK